MKMNMLELQEQTDKLTEQMPEGPFKNCQVLGVDSISIGDDVYTVEEAYQVLEWLKEILGDTIY